MLAGSTILFFFNPPIKHFDEGIHVFGPFISTTQNDADDDSLDEAKAYVNQSKVFSRIGFGLIAVGSFLQLYSLLLLDASA